MHTKESTRREFLKKVGMVGAALAVMPTAKAVGLHKGPETTLEWSKDNFFEQVIYMFHKVAELREKTRGVFNPYKNCFFVEVPRWMADDMMAAKHRSGSSSWAFLKETWPKSLWARTYTGDPLTISIIMNGRSIGVSA